MTTATSPSTSTAAIADELVALCRSGRNMEAIDAFYSPNIVSVESMGNEEMPAETSGLEAIRFKNKWWIENNDVHSAEADGPFVGDDKFAVHYIFDVTSRQTGKRNKMEEMALYTVENGKIVREHFFYKTS